MIGVEGQFIYVFEIGDLVDFVRTEELKSFNLTEYAGNKLPEFELVFTTDDERVDRYISEGFPLNVSYGDGIESFETVSLFITKSQIYQVGDQQKLFNLTGLATNAPYMQNPNISITASKSAVAAMYDIVGTHFKQDFNVLTSQDTMKWIQPNISNRMFVDNLWLHSYRPNSFPMIGITSDGKFRYRDMKTLLATTPTWTFTNNVLRESNAIIIDGDPIISSSEGIINSWVGYGRSKRVLNVEAGTESTVSEDVSPMMVEALEISRNSNILPKIGPIGVLTTNMHDNYWKAYQSNLMHLAIFSSHKVKLSYSNSFKPVRVLDFVDYIGHVKNSQNRLISSMESGRYIVSKVGRTIENNKISTVVELCREAYGDIKDVN